jgi:hypothetical protein
MALKIQLLLAAVQASNAALTAQGQAITSLITLADSNHDLLVQLQQSGGLDDATQAQVDAAVSDIESVTAGVTANTQAITDDLTRDAVTDSTAPVDGSTPPAADASGTALDTGSVPPTAAVDPSTVTGGDGVQ